jgi:hypothetical protein
LFEFRQHSFFKGKDNIPRMRSESSVFFGARIYACHNKASRGKEMGEKSALNMPRSIK